MLKGMAILANLAALGVIAFLLATEGLPRRSEDYGILAAFLVPPVLNLLYICFGEVKPETDSLWHFFVEAQKSKPRRQIVADTKPGGRSS